MMPQLNPIFYSNTTIFCFILIGLSIYFVSKYILPNIIRLFITRLYIKNHL